VDTSTDQPAEEDLCAALATLPGAAYRAGIELPRSLTRVSGSIVELTGRTAQSFLTGRCAWAEVVHPGDAAAVEREFEAARRARRSFSLVHRIVHSSGEVRCVLDRGEFVYDNAGGLVAFEGFVLDVTHLRRREQRLRESATVFRHTFEKVTIGLAHVRVGDHVSVGEHGRWLRVNERLCETFGYSREELLTMTFQELTHPDDLPTDLEQVERLLAGEIANYTLEKRYVRKNGEVFWANLTASVVRKPSGQPDYAIAVVEDISARKRAEAALRENEERLRLAQTGGGVGVFDLDLSTHEARCSNYFFDVIGHTPPPEGRLTLAEWRAWVHPDDRARVVAQTRAALAGSAENLTLEYRVLGEAEELRWVFSRAEIHRDANGDARRALGVIQDVTTRKDAEEQLRQAHERLSLAQRAGQAGLWDWDLKDGQAPFVSAEYRELYGVSGDEPVTYERWLELIHGQDRERVEAYSREVFAHGTEYTIDFRIQHPTRGLRWLSGNGLVRRDGEGRPARFSGVNLDITALKQAQQALRESEERLRKVIDSMFAFVGVLAPDGTLTEANRAPVAVLGVTRADVLGKKVWDTGWFNYDEGVRERLRTAYQRAVDGEIVRYDETVRTANDGRIVIDLMVQPVFDGDELQFLIPSAVDITDRKHAEEALKTSDRHKDDFLATLAHELRNPLAPLRTGLDVMKLSTDPATRERAREMMQRQLGHMVRLIDDLLDVSRIGRGKIRLKREPVSLELVVEHAVETSRPLIEAGGHQLTVHTPDPPLWVNGDLTRLAQVVGNLLNNSAKYTPEGGHIELTVSAERDQAVIQVADNRIGISPDVLPRVFDLFAQSDDCARAQGGLGIGLSLVHRIAEMHGGTVTAQSPGIGQGSTFTVGLPLIAVDRGPVRALDPERPRAGSPSKRVLVVDDNEDAAAMLATVLDLHGHQTRTAEDGPRALAAAAAFAPDIVFLDIGMPGMSGYEVAKRFRADPALAGVTLVALTGWGGEEDKQRTKAAGFDFHLTKPVEFSAIRAVLSDDPAE